MAAAALAGSSSLPTSPTPTPPPGGPPKLARRQRRLVEGPVRHLQKLRRSGPPVDGTLHGRPDGARSRSRWRPRAPRPKSCPAEHPFPQPAMRPRPGQGNPRRCADRSREEMGKCRLRQSRSIAPPPCDTVPPSRGGLPGSASHPRHAPALEDQPRVTAQSPARFPRETDALKVLRGERPSGWERR
jgi:hypothetical protein